MEFSEFKKEYGGLSKQEALGLINTGLVKLNRDVADNTLGKYYYSLKTLTENKALFKDIINKKYTTKDLADKYKVSTRNLEWYKAPLILFKVIEELPKYKPEKWRIEFNEFKEKFGHFSKRELINLGRKICEEQGRDCSDRSLETRAESMITISRKTRDFYRALISTKRKNNEIADKYNYSPRTIKKYRKALLLFGVTKHKNNTTRNHTFDLNLDDLLIL